MKTPPSDNDLPCIIPAAGRSSRMGDFKPLLPWKETSLCGAVVDKVLQAGFKPVLVTGYQAEAMRAAFTARAGLLITHNPDWQAGMVGSIQTGLRAALNRWPDLPGLLVAPADMPELPLEAFSKLGERGLALGVAGAEPTALFAARNGKLGHPVWIPALFIPEILKLSPGGQLRTHLLTKVWAGVEVEDDAIFMDIDTRDDYLAHTGQV